MEKYELRPCIVKTIETPRRSPESNKFIMPEEIEHKAHFHGWASDASGNVSGMIDGRIPVIFGIVEYEDGTVHRAPLESITFTDRKNEKCDTGKNMISEGDICHFGKNEEVCVYVTLRRGTADEYGYVEGIYLTGINVGHIGRFNIRELRKTDFHYEISNILKSVGIE